MVEVSLVLWKNVKDIFLTAKRNPEAEKNHLFFHD